MKKLRTYIVILFGLLLGILPGSSVRVYFDNSNMKWTTPKCYTWGTTSNNSWPGVAMTKVAGSLYYLEVTSGHTQCIFNSGDGGDSNQTIDVTFSDNHVYYCDGSYSGNKRNYYDKGSIVPTNLYVLGNVNGTEWNTSQGVQMTKSGNVFTKVVTIDNAGSGYGYFAFSSAIGANWDAVNVSNRFGAATEDEQIIAGIPRSVALYGTFSTSPYNVGACNSWKAAEGTYLVTADFDHMSVTIEEFSLSLNKSVISIGKGETSTLTATVSPEGAGTVTWTTSNASVATVAGGTVTGVANGEAVITATCNGVTATCNVYVGKSAQTITWSQTLPNLGVGKEVTLSATASSGLPVSYAVTAGSSFAHIADGKLIGDAPGIVTVQATQSGSSEYAPAEPVSKTVTIWLGYLMGDVNSDSFINQTDVDTTVGNILGQGLTPYNAAAADMNGDGKVNVVDVTRIVHLKQ